jgi:hypothetical protein
MSLSGIAFNGPTPFAALASSGLASLVGLPIVMLGVGGIYLGLGIALLSFASGGIQRVAREVRREYLALVAGSLPEGQ